MSTTSLPDRPTGSIPLVGALLAAVLAATLTSTPPAHAEVTTILVTTTADDGAGSLRAALEQAAESTTDDEVTFAPSVVGTIALTSGHLVASVGGTSGSLTITGPGRDVLALDAGGRSRVLDIMASDDTRPSVAVAGLTLRQGSGGGLSADGVDVTLTGVLVTASHSSDHGGGVAVHGGNLTIEESEISSNVTSAAGGGIAVAAAGAVDVALVVRDSLVADNRSVSQDWVAYGGGGVSAEGAVPVLIERTRILDNTSWHESVGMELYIVEGDGGGVSGRDVTLVDSEVSGNAAGGRGAGIWARDLTVRRSTLSGNTTPGVGGGAGASGTVVLESSTVSDNHAARGGGIELWGAASAQLTESTVVDNVAVTGGGVHADGAVDGPRAELSLDSSVVANNPGGDLHGLAAGSMRRSLVRSPGAVAPADTAGLVTGKDPVLGRLGDHGGPTPTQVPASNSPTVDEGGATTVSPVDQRGFPRPVGDAPDMGAVELTPAEREGLPQVVSTARPVIEGITRVGETLTVRGDDWAPSGVSKSYQWLRNGVPIAGATRRTYTATSDDFDRNWWGDDRRRRLSVRVTAAREEYHASTQTSDYTRFVRKGRLVASRPPTVKGRVQVGSVLRARPRLGAVSPRPLGVQVVWRLDGRVAKRATGDRRFVLRPRMRGMRVSVRFIYRPPTGYLSLTRDVRKRGRVS